ncbi:hypothetical protein [Luteolibacter sp. LG18]|uniref:hypothetical protein n=1 Tax=Luteolibacter sp. LG18 TaxID=2819286 RepID=UPI002B2ED7A5|nr:hypothetical protein llg_15970 [Luteolibacter sp. LG18]
MKRLLSKLLAALVLAALTVAAWQFRFEHAGPPLSRPFEPGLPGWEWKGGKGREANPDVSGAVTIARNLKAGDPAAQVERVLGTLNDVRFLHVELDAKWDEVVQDGEVRWATARAIVYGRQKDGSAVFPHDHGIISAYGSAPWHHEEAVFDLVPGSGELRFALEHWGSHGSMAVRNVEISMVRQRAWFRPVASGLVVLWVAWAAWWVVPALGRWKWPRAVLAGCALVGATWFLVFPQPRFCARTLAGQFQLGSPIPPPPVVPKPPEPPAPVAPAPVEPPVAVVPVIPPPVAEPPPVVAPVPPVVLQSPPPPPAPEKREERAVDEGIRRLRDRFNFLHVVAFGAFGVALFGFARPRVWPIAAVIAFASEALPNYQLHQAWDRGDLGDLLADGAGLALAAVVVAFARKWWRKRYAPTGHSHSGDSASGKPLLG